MKSKVTASLAIALFAASLAASAAEAQTNRQRLSPAAAAARAQAAPSARINGQPQSEKVFEWGKEQGRDPDINVRLMLRRDVHN
jgi:hypothetical protein